MRLLHHLGDSLSLGLDVARALLLLIVMMLVHFALVLLKIDFVDSVCPDLECLDVARSTFHHFPPFWFMIYPLFGFRLGGSSVGSRKAESKRSRLRTSTSIIGQGHYAPGVRPRGLGGRLWFQFIFFFALRFLQVLVPLAGFIVLRVASLLRSGLVVGLLVPSLPSFSGLLAGSFFSLRHAQLVTVNVGRKVFVVAPLDRFCSCHHRQTKAPFTDRLIFVTKRGSQIPSFSRCLFPDQGGARTQRN